MFDARIAAIARQFEDFKQAEASGAVRMAEDVAALAEATGLPQANLCATLSEIPQGQTDRYGRRFGETRLTPPYAAVKVTGALFHTQGGIAVDPPTARARLSAGGLMENLHATGGAACGVSGTGDSGYLSGNGLLSAVTLGWIAGSRSG